MKINQKSELFLASISNKAVELGIAGKTG